MEWLKSFIGRNFESLLVLVIIAMTSAGTYLFDYKLAFLNFYFLPISLAGYYLGTRKAVLSATFSFLAVAAYVIIYPQAIHFSNTQLEVWMGLVLWGAFLILSAVIVGQQHEAIIKEVQTIKGLNEKLTSSLTDLNSANTKLQDYTTNLEKMVSERTASLLESKEAIESLKLKVEETLFKSMDRNVAKLVIDGRLRTEKRFVSVLFSDLVSFTEYSSKQNPEIVVQQLNKYLEEMESVLLRYQGHIDKYLGDGIMAEFGAPIDFDKHCLLAVLAALKMQEILRANHMNWKMRIGISSGLTILGMIGSKRQSYTSIGDTVNLASRIEANCPPGAVAIDEQTAKEIHEYVNLRPLENAINTKFKGFSVELRVYEVLGLKDVFANNPAYPEELVRQYLPAVKNCGISDSVTLPVEALDGSIGHSQKVALLATAMADRMGLSEHEKREITQAAFAADCGKEIVHHHILNRKGRLSDMEYEDVKRHPEESARALIKIGYESATLLNMIRHTHERMDGKGYPSGLRGKAIPLGSRIIAVADAYSALTSYRPYREKWEMAAAIADIERSVIEGHFDGEVVAAFKAIVLATEKFNRNAA